ncbi:alcohol dehydrogenase-like protein [Thermothelomyces thermophilus ATCC 42464]|uniref:Alcohol dehydrogenase-like protein n=1 Tax=Thermothelomyces thermophilus (strain ATCC 42464 / BCRC 31852 / DSM 1799) TaxID=573729 RepID=G2QJU3_THET4|nr:alcohol dehydrogenase-like protein [Thermothelomyces thermophilus ATCC 42464]AEO59849.1 alcohol dehydrogenase-like protein [Thermothelomyces thermophilus ATCC 42464]
MSPTMKEALVSKGTQVEIVDSPIPNPNENQVLIKVVVSGSNPKDWKLPEWFGGSTNQGDDIAGIVEKVGANVFEFKPGDRVAAFHEMRTSGGSYAEYAIAWQHTTFHIPESVSFEEAAAVPLAAMTAAVGLYLRLGLPQPWSPATTQTPLIIYGAASAVGIYAVQLARRSNIHPILCVAGRATDYVAGFLDPSKGDAVVDYRQGDEAVVSGLVRALDGRPPVAHVLDAVSEKSSVPNVVEVLKRAGARDAQGKLGAKVTFVLGVEQDLPEGVDKTLTMVGTVHKEAKDFGYVYFRYFAKGLQEGWFKPQRTEVVPGGLGGIQTALLNLRDGKASAVKYVFRIAETEGVQR